MLVKRLVWLTVISGLSWIWAAPSLASSAGNGSINTLLPISGGLLFFSHTGARTAKPACATQDRWVINGTTDGGRIIISTLLSAYALGKQVSVQGNGACGNWTDTETVDYIIVQ
jgi:hypothetical protein